MTRAIFFDIGNVLIFFDYDKMCRQIGNICGISPEKVKEELLEHGIHNSYEKGEMSTDDIWNHFKKISSKQHSKEEFLFAISDIFHLNEPLSPIVQKLKEKGTKLLLLSNTNEAHYEFLTGKFEILEGFHHEILSHRVRARKPEKEIFFAALEAAQCPPEECFYVDDLPEYIAVARELGIDAELFKDVPGFMEHLRQRGLL